MSAGDRVDRTWDRLRAALMPDYSPAAARMWFVLVALGAVVLPIDLWLLRDLDAGGWLQIAAGAGAAALMGLFPLRVPGTRNAFVAGEIFLFLLLLLQGPAAAALAAVIEAAVGSWRSSRRWTSRLFSPAVAALAMSSSAGIWQALTGGSELLAAPVLITSMVLMAALCFFINTQLVLGIQRCKQGLPYFQWSDLVSLFRWVGLAYGGSAVLATLLYLAYRSAGVMVLVAVLPVLVLLLVALHCYFLQQELAQHARQTAATASEQAARHLQALQASERRFHGAFTHAGVGMALLGFDGAVLQANPALRRLLGLAPDSALPARLHDLVHGSDQSGLNQKLALASGQGAAPFQLELRLRHQDGRALWVLAHGSVFTDPEQGQPCLILQVQDISARRQAEAGLQRLAFHDSLTGLPNRRQFNELLAGAVARCKADPSASFAVMYLDFDRFKLVNDSLGHNAGDELLVQLARRIHEKLRPSDIVARLGGDEFALLVPHLQDNRDALQLADRLLEAMRRPFSVAGRELVASVSIGITFSSLGYGTPEQMLRDADTAMYKAKSDGKARYALFDDSQHQEVSSRFRLEGELRVAIEEGQLDLAYQALLDLSSGEVTGFEALLRWQHPQDGNISPAAIIPVAEETGLIAPLSDFVLQRACAQLALWHELFPGMAGLGISVNVSGHDITSRSFVERVSRVIAGAGIPASGLTLELTEEAVMTQIDSAVANLQALRALGVRLAVDDFGTGYSSLSRLAQLPIDSLKIDRAFIHQMTEGSDEAAVVQAVLQLGGALRKTVVAEGIETPAQAELLKRLGCQLGQGFHLGRPLSATEATAWLAERAAPPVQG